jgi:hypothetical protein
MKDFLGRILLLGLIALGVIWASNGGLADPGDAIRSTIYDITH